MNGDRRQLAGLWTRFLRGSGAVGTSASVVVAEIHNSQPQALGIFSTSLYGTNTERYLQPLLTAIPEYKAAHPYWVIRVYLAPNVPEDWLLKLIAAGVEIYIMQEAPVNLEASMWRYLPLGEAKPFVVIDADNRYHTDSYQHIETWLQSDKQFYYAPQRYERFFWPIRAHCWGARNAPIPHIQQLLTNFGRECNVYGCDEQFLTRYIYPLMTLNNTYLLRGWESSDWQLSIIIIALVIILMIGLALFYAPTVRS